jgi:hypothetical protein
MPGIVRHAVVHSWSALESLAIAIASSSESYAMPFSTRPKISYQASVISFLTFTTSAVAVVARSSLSSATRSRQSRRTTLKGRSLNPTADAADIIRPTDGQVIARVTLAEEEHTRRRSPRPKHATYGRRSTREESTEILRQPHEGRFAAPR